MFRQQRTRVCKALVGAIVSSLLASAAPAATMIQTGFFIDVFGESFYGSPGAPTTGFFFSEESVTGIAKFDPSMGTLNSVKLTADFDSDVEISTFANDVVDPAQTHDVDFDADTVPMFIGYEPGGLGSTFVLIDRTYDAFSSCFGAASDFPCSDTIFDSDSTSGMSLVSGLGGYLPSDFIGVGDVTALSAIIAVPGEGLFTLDNVTDAEAEIFGNLYYVDLTVEYDFTPVPEPGTGLLVAAGILGLALRRRSAA